MDTRDFILNWFFASLLQLPGGRIFLMVDKQLLLVLGHIPLRVSVIVRMPQAK